MKPLPTAALLLSLALLSGCGLASHKTVAFVTNRIELASYAETYNASQDFYRVEIRYREKPSEALLQEDLPPDVVISEGLTGRNILSRFYPLDKLFEKKNMSREAFYPGLLAMGQKDKRQMLMPLAFDLPLVMYDSRIVGEENGLFSLNLEKIREIGGKFNRQENGKTTFLGFSPRWDPSFLYLCAAAQGADFTEGNGLPLVWNSRNLKQAMGFINDWTEKTNGGENADLLYAEKNLYDPPYRQASLGRVKFAYSKASDFFLLPENRRLSLDFRWVSHKDRISALECVLFGGIPLKSKNPRGGEAFLLWLLDPETQKKLLGLAAKKTGHNFGLASGFSSLRQVNEREYPRLYPLLVGHIPPADVLQFPPPVPSNWKDLKEQLLIPWMMKQGSGSQNEDLESLLKAWSLKHTD